MTNLDKTSLWETVLAELQLSLSGANFQTWFKGKTSIISINNSLVEIGCSSPYNKVWVEERYFGKIKEVIDRVTGVSNTLVFSVSSQDLGLKPKKRAVVAPSTVPLFDEAAPIIQEAIEQANINPKYSFSNFVVGQSNQLAFAASKAVSEAPFEHYNPFLVYGGVGVGKTHLVSALAHAVVLRRAQAKVLYTSSETFTNEMVAAIQNRQTSTFRGKYRAVDVLVVDDIQFIAGRESTQEEFFHTFNHLYNLGKQLVFSCDRDPGELEKLQDRLKSRFIGGLMVKIDSPDLELREAILLAKSRDIGLDLDFSTIRLLAENLGPSIRDLEGGLLRLAAASKLVGKKVDISLVESVVSLTSKKPEKNIDYILEEVAKFFSIKVGDL